MSASQGDAGRATEAAPPAGSTPGAALTDGAARPDPHDHGAPGVEPRPSAPTATEDPEDPLSSPYLPHPHVSGRTAALRALAAWREEWPGTPRVIALTGSPGSGRSRLLAGFLMLCDPRQRTRLPIGDLDPTTVPPDMPAPVAVNAAGRTATEVLRAIADQLGLRLALPEHVLTRLAVSRDTVTVVVSDVDRAGPIRGADEPARLVREVLRPLAGTRTVRLLTDVPRALAPDLTAALPPGRAQVLDLDEDRWDEPDGVVHQVSRSLDPAHGARALPFTTDATSRRALARAVAERAGGSRLTAHLTLRSLLFSPEGFGARGFDADGAEELTTLPGTPGEALDFHARRLGTDGETLRLLLAPLAFAEGDGLPAGLWGPLTHVVAGRDLSARLTGVTALAAPFVQRVSRGPRTPAPGDPAGRPDAGERPEAGEWAGTGEVPRSAVPVAAESSAPADAAAAAETSAALAEAEEAVRAGGSGGAPRADDASGSRGQRRLLRLVHPALAEEIRTRLPDARAAQVRLATALLKAVPRQDWSHADPYICDYLGGHTLEAGLLPQLLTDPGLFVHADPAPLHAAVSAVEPESLGAPARTYLRTAALLPRGREATRTRAALLETAFAEDGLQPYADALHDLDPELPWRTLWSLPLKGVTAVRTGLLPAGPGTSAPQDGPSDGAHARRRARRGAGSPRAVVALVVPEGTPGARPLRLEPRSDGTDEAADAADASRADTAGIALTADTGLHAVASGADTVAVLLHGLHDPRSEDADPATVLGPSAAQREAAELGMRVGSAGIRVWDRESQETVAELPAGSPFVAADLSPEGVLVVATTAGVKALQIAGSSSASAPRAHRAATHPH